MENPDTSNRDISPDEENQENAEPKTESGSGELDEDALRKGQDSLDQAGGGH